MTLILADLIHATDANVVRLLPDGRVQHDELSVADLEREVGPVTTDSRTVREHGVFVALRGEQTDGHAFATAALGSGARVAIVSKTANLREFTVGVRDARDPVYLLLVTDPLTALHDLATYWLERHSPEVIGVTGSIGKTTTKEIIASVLAYRSPVLKNLGNLNTEVGLPLTLLELRPHHTAAVLEMGMYGLGDIALLARIARPRIGVVTNVAPIHLERIGTIERIAKAKSELVAALPANGLAVLNGDDQWTRAMAQTSGIAPSVLVGMAPDCTYRASDVVMHGLDGISFTLHADGMEMHLETQVPGAHTVHAFLSAIAVARELHMAWEDIQEAVAVAKLDARQRLIRDRAGVLIIDDSYNAAPQSMQAALDLLAASPGDKIAVLGDMLELGPQEEELHHQVGVRVAHVADWLVLRGQRSEWVAQAALASGFDSGRIVRCDSNSAAAQAVLRITSALPVAAGSSSFPTMPSGQTHRESEDTVQWSVLVKGSRGMEMEEIVEHLRGEA